MNPPRQTVPTPSGDALRDAASVERLTRTFTSSLTVVDLARPLLSLDESQSARAGIKLMESSGEQVLGVRRSGRAAGWVSRPTLPPGGLLADHLKLFQDDETLADSEGIQAVLEGITGRDQVFVRWLGNVAGVVHRTDLQKAPVRMWLFGVVTLLEANLTWAVEELHPHDAWTGRVTEGRLQKAVTLRDERRRRGSNCRLVDCLQIKDKVDVLMKDAAHIKLLGLTSKREADRFGRDIETLRNQLAHGQELENAHLATACRLAASLDGILRADMASKLVQTRNSAIPP